MCKTIVKKTFLEWGFNSGNEIITFKNSEELKQHPARAMQPKTEYWHCKQTTT
jgi:hypothetical protein